MSALLQLDKTTIRFGGLTAVSTLDLQIAMKPPRSRSLAAFHRGTSLHVAGEIASAGFLWLAATTPRVPVLFVPRHP